MLGKSPGVYENKLQGSTVTVKEIAEDIGKKSRSL